MKAADLLKQNWRGMFMSFAIGLTAIAIRRVSKSPVFDPLLVALAIGIAIRALTTFDTEYVSSLKRASSSLISIGVIFYGATNLRFDKFSGLDVSVMFLLSIVFIVYIVSTLLLSSLFGLGEKAGYLIAAGSSICGASAIAITSNVIDAEPDDVSISLIPVYISGLIGLLIILPALGSYFKIPEMRYGILSGTVLQFTGFVKSAVSNFSADVKTAALSIKAIRYIALLFILPLFASFIRGRFYTPWYLWAFLGAGLLFSFIPGLVETYGPPCKAILAVLWSAAMGAIGLNADMKGLATIRGLKAFLVSFISFLIATAVYVTAISFAE